MTQPEKGGRPRKPAGEVRSQYLRSRVTVDEHVLLMEKAAEEGLTLSDFVRESALMRARGEMESPTGELKRNVRLFDFEMYREVNKIGVNLNQVANRFNEITYEPPRGLNRVTTELLMIARKLREGLSHYK